MLTEWKWVIPLFGTDLTWLGWIYVVFAMLTVLTNFISMFIVKDVGMTRLAAFNFLLATGMIVGFFAVGFTH